MEKLDSPSLEEQETYWDSWQETSSITTWSLRRAETILTLLRSLSLDHPKILDLGCGNGWFTDRLAELGQATGIDLSKKAMAMATARFPHAEFLAGDLLNTSLPTEHFDVVVSQQVIAHVTEQARYVELAARVLKSGGHLIVSTPNKFVMDRLDWGSGPREHIEKWLDMKGLKRLLCPHFDVLQTTTILPMGNRGILGLINSDKVNRTMGCVMSQQYLETLKERAGLGYTMIVLARKKA